MGKLFQVSLLQFIKRFKIPWIAGPGAHILPIDPAPAVRKGKLQHHRQVQGRSQGVFRIVIGHVGFIAADCSARPGQSKRNGWPAQSTPCEKIIHNGVVIEECGIACSKNTELTGLEQKLIRRFAVYEDAEVRLHHPGVDHALHKHKGQVVGRIAPVLFQAAYIHVMREARHRKEGGNPLGEPHEPAIHQFLGLLAGDTALPDVFLIVWV